jgi:GNAT superfamily N-acetyltransferase
MLRLARETDLGIVSRLSKEFFTQTQYGRSIEILDENIESVARPFLQPINKDSVCIIWDQNPNFGIIGGLMNTIPFIQRKVAVECMWYVDPELRGSKAGEELLEAFEHWAYLSGADMIQMMCLPDGTGKLLDRYYKRRGYRLTELTYTKEL